jgi:hypothetical protein
MYAWKGVKENIGKLKGYKNMKEMIRLLTEFPVFSTNRYINSGGKILLF